MSMTLELSIGMHQTRESCIGSCLPKSHSFIIKNKIKIELPKEILGERLRSIMDSVLVHFIPTFEAEIYDYYQGDGERMINLYTEEEIASIDNFLLEVLQSNSL